MSVICSAIVWSGLDLPTRLFRISPVLLIMYTIKSRDCNPAKNVFYSISCLSEIFFKFEALVRGLKETQRFIWLTNICEGKRRQIKSSLISFVFNFWLVYVFHSTEYIHFTYFFQRILRIYVILRTEWKENRSWMNSPSSRVFSSILHRTDVSILFINKVWCLVKIRTLNSNHIDRNSKKDHEFPMRKSCKFVTKSESEIPRKTLTRRYLFIVHVDFSLSPRVSAL